MNEEKLRLVYQGARAFLENLVGKEILEEKLEHLRTYKAGSLIDLYWHLLLSLTNKRSMVNTIGPIDPLALFLFDFDPAETHLHYNHDWRRLFQVINDGHKPPGPMDITNEQSYWSVFCKGALSGAAFLTSFGSLDSADAFIMGFQHHDLSIPALPMVMEREIYGMGFALACDFLREAGYTNYGKPDVHVKDILFGLEIVEYRDNYEVFKALLRMARVSDELPVIVDKVLYLIGSGNIGKPDIKIGRQKKVFIEEMQAKLAGFDTDLGNGRREDGEGADRKNPEGRTG
jgi:hypothetical protein